MKPVVIRGSQGKAEFMEIVGPNGLKVGELEIKPNNEKFKPPYELIQEAHNVV